MATLIGIKYVGTKNRPQADTVAGTTLVWFDTKEVHYVTPDVAYKLLKHPGVWAEVGRKQGKDDEAASMLPAKKIEEPELPPLVPLEAMGREALVEYAQRNFNQKLAHNMTEANMRGRIRNWMNDPRAHG